MGKRLTHPHMSNEVVAELLVGFMYLTWEGALLSTKCYCGRCSGVGRKSKKKTFDDI